MLLYCQYKENKKHGITCLFQDGIPRLIQEWNAGDLESEAVFSFSKESGWESIEDPKQLAEAKKKLSDAEEALKETEKETRRNLRQWFEEGDKRIKEQNVKLMRPIKEAQANARRQNVRKTQAAVVAGAHPWEYSRIGGAARALRDAASVDLSTAKSHASARTNEARNALQQRAAILTEESRKLYEFALESLEKSL